MGVEKEFTKAQRKAIQEAIAQAEKNTSGEIRVHIDAHCEKDPMNKAIAQFETLKMHETAARNGVLIYLAFYDRKVAIIGDKGIDDIVPTYFWDNIRDNMIASFQKGEYTQGLVQAILQAGEQLKESFPYQSDDVNELSDEISFEKDKKD